MLEYSSVGGGKRSTNEELKVLEGSESMDSVLHKIRKLVTRDLKDTSTNLTNLLRRTRANRNK